MMTDSNEQQGEALLPCPFCGVTPTRRNHVYRYGSIAEHPEGAHCPIENTTIGVKAWNTRRASLAAVPNHALAQLLESALLHPESAEGNIRQVIEILNAAASSPLPAEELPFDDYCAGAGDCRACKGINCTCPHHAPAAEPESLYATCRRVWVCKRCGNCLDHCRHQDESNFHEDLAMPCSVKTPAEPPSTDAHRCPHCGRHMVSEFDEDVGFWRECANCDYRELVSSAPAEPEGERENRL